ncbi:MAG TPA: ABC transporter permease [Thermoanaerobaculia bacterium]|nr:ABC transporter permease [Thermoanaerobaculia bacterium]
MDLKESVDGAFSNLAARKLRTALTMLGMIFGVGAVIAMLSIGAGAEKKALEMIDRLGLHNVIVKASEIKDEDRQEIRKKSLGVSPRDGEAIRQAIAGVEIVLPRLEVKTWKIHAAGNKSEAKVFGLSALQPTIAVVPMSEGRFFDTREESDHAQVGVIGERVKRDLFGYGNALGQQIKVNDLWIEVIGVLAPESGTSTQDGIPVSSTENEIYIPVTTAMRKFDRDPLDAPLDELIVRLRPGTSSRAAADQIDSLLDRLHGGARDYELVVPEALLEQSRRTQRIFNIVMGSIAGISLLVGGIGIMNIMLASVLERTREIGVRRALGATKRDIRTQFVIESFAISVLGGFIGVAIGVFLARIVAAMAEWPTVVTLWSLLLSTGVSITVGLVSGIYPATRAANLDPIEALRYE